MHSLLVEEEEDVHRNAELEDYSHFDGHTSSPPPPVVPPVSDALSQAVADAVKDFPGVQTSLTDGVLTLTGEIERTNLQSLMQRLNALKSMGITKIESAGLVKK